MTCISVPDIRSTSCGRARTSPARKVTRPELQEKAPGTDNKLWSRAKGIYGS
ncbi:MAG: hypothetical protein OP8BY_0075 [Candidatus Saccharicenans subterraneus]|uniref:Uncharacterized protein n=1 Tax=Candidatus Saccharicenans subterraneus TaxID=2508984 RepID=A0A3E2BLT2_9BACT|nr:MAG: hypothetical protein OP8BY_0075 [Candidatus Saccharicenans subterraneum]